jgi:predicted O-methyltransferase YrrM
MPTLNHGLGHRVSQLTALMRFMRMPQFLGSLKEAGGLMLDQQFYYSSPLPELPGELLSRISSVEVTLPDRSLLTDGTQNLEGLVFLVSLAKFINARRIFEIGTFTGVTAATLAQNLPNAEVHTLDLPPARAPDLAIEPGDAKYIAPRRRVRVFDGTPQAARIIQHEADSAQFDFPSHGIFDLVYIDGAHSYQYVENDTRAAFGVVSQRGAVVWDDYQRHWPGVVDYLNQRSSLKLYRAPGTRLIVWAPSVSV